MKAAKLEYAAYPVLAVLLLTIPFVIVVGELMDELDYEIQFAQKEQYGTEYHKKLVEVMQSTQIQRGAVFFNDIEVDIKKEELYQQRKMDELDLLSKKLKSKLEVIGLYNLLKIKHLSLKKPTDESKDEVFENFTFFIKNVKNLMTHVADISNLITDPELKTYYLMNMNVNVIPEIIENISWARGKISGIRSQEGQAFSKADKLQLFYIYKSLLAKEEEFERSVLVSFNESGSTRDALLKNFKATELSYKEFMLALKNVLEKNVVEISAEEIFSLGTKTIDAYKLVYDNSSVVLNKLLQERIDKKQEKKVFINSFSALVIVGLVIGAFVSYTNSIKRYEAEQEIVKAKEGLEKEVEHRTMELSKATNELVSGNIKLQKEVKQREIIQKEIEAAKEKAEEANRAKSEFLANMSHELRTPMNGIMGLTDLLLDSPLNEEQKEFADLIYSSSDNLLMILNDILDLSKIEAGMVSVEEVPFDPVIMANELVKLYSPAASKKGLALSAEIKSKLPAVLKGDLAKIQQVLRNLLGNSLKFTEKGGVYIEVETKETDGAQNIYFYVRDTGIGISQDRQEKIFEKFTQADETTTRKFGGTGLGLTICRSFAEMMGGKVGVESEIGKGSRFWLCLPMVIAEEGEEPVNILTRHKNLSSGEQINARILVADDHPINRIYAMKVLQKLGFEKIDMVENGAQAVEAIEKEKYSIVLMDCQMPVMDGYQATKEIRAKEKDSAERLPIIAVTANAMVGDRETCIKAGMNEYISKPIKMNILANIISNLIGVESNVVDEKDKKEEVTAKSVSDTLDPIDMEHFSMFTDGDKDEEKALFEMFFDQAYKSLDTLKNNCKDGENEEWRGAAHKLKGASANLGANQLSSVCAQAEKAFDKEEKDKQALFESIQTELEKVKKFTDERITAA